MPFFVIAPCLLEALMSGDCAMIGYDLGRVVEWEDRNSSLAEFGSFDSHIFSLTA